MGRVAAYAREIVPSFSTYAYFRLATPWPGPRREPSTGPCRVRRRRRPLPGGPEASVVFVMNHRSNMDYVLVSYLAAEKTALSYAVGEWARIWPLQSPHPVDGGLLRAARLGRPALRRCSSATCRWRRGRRGPGHVPGGRADEGRRAAPSRLGLLDYMLRDYDPARRDLVFVRWGSTTTGSSRPHQLGAAAASAAERRTPPWARPARRAQRLAVAGRPVAPLRLRCVNFGTPISMRSWLAERGGDLRGSPARSDRAASSSWAPSSSAPSGRSSRPARAARGHRPPRQRGPAHLARDPPAHPGALAAHPGFRRSRLRPADGRGVRDGGRAPRALPAPPRRGAGRRLLPVPPRIPVLRYYANSIRHLLPEEM